MQEKTQSDSLFRGIEHIGIAVRNTEQATNTMVTLLRAEKMEELVSEELGLRLTFLKVAGTNVELLEPLRDDTPVARFLETKGEGFHHIAFAVSDIRKILSGLREAGVRLVEPAPRKGAHGGLVAFVHPSSANGVLIELCERNKP